ncbi:cytochrome P450 [Micromonospora peucetia]|uniref:cytochrome P450 n=1 Tax=Micromonospora peucetia TaxID=47871 RepID=UPI002255B58F|nr:cytochrome P450 [Micromonospora peucetia]MCX4389009.1 cytochrome P450 [Micromonospora peucetia]
MTAEQTAPDPVFDTFFDDPHGKYRELHASGCPVRRVVTPQGIPAWFVTEHDAVRQGLRDPRLSRKLDNAGPGYQRAAGPTQFLAKSVVTEDPPEHTRLRRALNQAFAPRSIKRLEPRIVALTDELIDHVAKKLAETGQADLMADLALPLPLIVIAEMLGVPVERRADFQRWGDGMLALDPKVQKESGAAMIGFLGELVEAKTSNPGDDMLSYWVTARDQEGKPYDAQEILSLTTVMLVGGYDTSVGMIAGTLLALLADRERFADVFEDPDRLPSVMEEFLRLYGTVHTGVRRFATEDFELAGQDIAKGDAVLLSIGAANRDPNRYPNPDEVAEERLGNRNHLAFGLGPHICPGNELARLEIEIAVRAVLTRLPRLRLAVSPSDGEKTPHSLRHAVPYRRAYFIRVPLAVPVELDTEPEPTAS